MAKTAFERLMEKVKTAPSTAPQTTTSAQTAASSETTPAAPKAETTPAAPATTPQYTNKQKLACLSAKHERFDYSYTKKGEFFIIDTECSKYIIIPDIAEQIIKWDVYGGKELAFLRQKNGKTTVIDEKLKVVSNLDNVKVVEREDGWWLEYTDAVGEEWESPLVTKPAKPVRKPTNLF